MLRHHRYSITVTDTNRKEITKRAQLQKNILCCTNMKLPTYLRRGSMKQCKRKLYTAYIHMLIKTCTPHYFHFWYISSSEMIKLKCRCLRVRIQSVGWCTVYIHTHVCIYLHFIMQLVLQDVSLNMYSLTLYLSFLPILLYKVILLSPRETELHSFTFFTLGFIGVISCSLTHSLLLLRHTLDVCTGSTP